MGERAAPASGDEVASRRHAAPATCPVCGEDLVVARLECPRCGTALEGRFGLCSFCRMSAEQRQFAEMFIAARGNLREMERMLGLSYPAIRARLEAVIQALGYPPEGVTSRAPEAGPARPAAPPGTEGAQVAGKPEGSAARHAPVGRAERQAVLEALDRGEITVEQALARLRGHT